VLTGVEGAYRELVLTGGWPIMTLYLCVQTLI
jgi:hypothetical protein